jgi:hypothetical protein
MDEIRIPNAETAFVVYKDMEGNWHATPEMSEISLIVRKASIQDIGTGVHELSEFIDRELLVQAIVARITPQQPLDLTNLMS